MVIPHDLAACANLAACASMVYRLRVTFITSSAYSFVKVQDLCVTTGPVGHPSLEPSAGNNLHCSHRSTPKPGTSSPAFETKTTRHRVGPHGCANTHLRRCLSLWYRLCSSHYFPRCRQVLSLKLLSFGCSAVTLAKLLCVVNS